MLTPCRETPPLLISMHMEKCGGTSLDRLLRKVYGEGFCLYDPSPPESQQEPDFPPSTRCVHGHMFYGLHDYFPGQQCLYVTLLRDPVARFLSNFDHLRRFEHPLQSLARGRGGLDRFSRSYEARHYRNLFVRRLSGAQEDGGEADVDRAEQAIRDFAVVGVLERVDAFIASCISLLDWPDVPFGRHNASPANRGLAAELGEGGLELVREANRWDLELMSRLGDVIIR